MRQRNSFGRNSQLPTTSDKSSIFEKTTWIFGIIGVIISTYFAYKTYYNTDQINKLDSLIANNQTLIKESNEANIKLSLSIDELKEENNHLASMNLKLCAEDSTLSEDNNILGKELINSNRQTELSNRYEVLKRRAEAISLYTMTHEIIYNLPTDDEVVKWSTLQCKSFFKEINEQISAIRATRLGALRQQKHLRQQA